MYCLSKKSFRHLTAMLALCASAAGFLRAEPVINEFMASNTKTLADDDGAFSDWIEIRNPDPSAVSLAGWYLTDTVSNKTKWKLPAVTLPPGGYLVVFASNKNRTDAAKPLHTNFALSAGGEYLGLVRPDGATVVSEYAPSYPAQADDDSYGLAQGSGEKGVLQNPTPGAANGPLNAEAPDSEVAFSRPSGPFSENFTLEMSGAAADEKIRYVAAAPSASGADVPEPTALSPEYTGPLALTSSVIIRAAIFSADGSARGTVSTAHYVKLGASVANFSSQLPVLVLDNHGFGPLLVKDGIDRATWLYAYEPRADASSTFSAAPDLGTPLTTSVRGQSSADFQKKSFNLKFTNEAGKKRALPILDLPAHEKWALVAPFNYDRTFIHNAFTYSLSNKIGRWAPRTQLAEVFFNTDGGNLDSGSYAGIYILTDRIEVGVERANITPLAKSDTSAPAITGGYILKIDLKDSDEYAFITEHGLPDNGVSSVVVAYPKDEDLAPAQRDYIRNYVQDMEDALFADRASGWATRTYLDYIDRDSWVDHHLLNTLVGNLDAFDRSAYFTKNRGGKLEAGPVWDFDRALGSTDARNDRPDDWLGDEVITRSVWSRGWWELLTRDPEFMQDWVDRWQSLRQSEFSNSNLTTLIDSHAAAIGAAAAAREVARWPENTSRYGNHAGEVAHMKSWLTARADWIDRQFLAAPTVSTGGNLRFAPPAGAQLVYTLDGTDPRSLGGEIAPNAIVSNGPIEVPVSANVHVRSYRAELKGVFPGSPWSSVVGGASASALFPQSRLVNLSSRGVVGTGENALIAGVVVNDTNAKRYISRAVGPGLAAFGATGVVTDPQLSVFTRDGVEIYRNTGWETGPDAADLPAYFRAVGAFPLISGSKDSALADEKRSGAYTLQITTPSGQEGIGLAELYELDTQGRTMNLSTRAMVRTGAGVLVGGFVTQGASHKRMLIRAVGPTLTGLGVGNALADPMLTLYSGQTAIATNDRWSASPDAAIIETATTRVGAFKLATDSEDAALFVTVPPGAYTVEIRGKNNTEGVALLEIYEVP